MKEEPSLRPGLLAAAFTALLSVLISGCASAASSAKSSPTPAAASVAAGPIDCGDPTPVVYDETPWSTPWAVAGRFRFAAYGLVSFYPGIFGAKVPIDVMGPLEMPVSLRGWRCSHGHPLRFKYGAGTIGPFPSVQAYEAAGDLVATLDSPRYGDGWIGIGTGYMLFTTPGKWKVSVFRRDEVVASVVLLVS